MAVRFVGSILCARHLMCLLRVLLRSIALLGRRNVGSGRKVASNLFVWTISGDQFFGIILTTSSLWGRVVSVCGATAAYGDHPEESAGDREDSRKPCYSQHLRGNSCRKPVLLEFMIEGLNQDTPHHSSQYRGQDDGNRADVACG